MLHDDLSLAVIVHELTNDAAAFAASVSDIDTRLHSAIENLKRLYNAQLHREALAFNSMMAAPAGTAYVEAQILYSGAVSAVGIMQAVLHELGIKCNGKPLEI